MAPPGMADLVRHCGIHRVTPPHRKILPGEDFPDNLRTRPVLRQIKRHAANATTARRVCRATFGRKQSLLLQNNETELPG